MVLAIPKVVAALIPCEQLLVTERNIREFQDAIARLQAALINCPKIHETDGLEEHPAIFHYFGGTTDIFICEYDGVDEMFGYCILGDLYTSEWGYFSLAELTKNRILNIDYHFEEQSIEAALYGLYPDYFKKPQSLAA